MTYSLSARRRSSVRHPQSAATRSRGRPGRQVITRAVAAPHRARRDNGGLMKRSPDTPSPVITVDVESIDDALRRIEGAGGRTVRPRTEIPGMGSFAYFQDTEGNVLGLWESSPQA